MGVVASKFTRYTRRFNIIERTDRIMNKEKPIPAPLHKVDADRLNDLLKSNFSWLDIYIKVYNIIEISTLILDNPQVKEELANKNSTLEQNLESVYVTSKGDVSNPMFCFFFSNSV